MFRVYSRSAFCVKRLDAHFLELHSLRPNFHENLPCYISVYIIARFRGGPDASKLLYVSVHSVATAIPFFFFLKKKLAWKQRLKFCLKQGEKNESTAM